MGKAVNGIKYPLCSLSRDHRLRFTQGNIAEDSAAIKLDIVKAEACNVSFVGGKIL